jgi:hypothetical protein
VFQFFIAFPPFCLVFLLPFLFTFVFVSVFRLVWISYLAYPNLLRTKRVFVVVVFPLPFYIRNKD